MTLRNGIIQHFGVHPLVQTGSQVVFDPIKILRFDYD